MAALGALVDSLRASLGPNLRDEGALRELAALVDFDAQEASVRGGSEGVNGRRMMLERAPTTALGPLSRALGVPLDASSDELRAASTGLPLIAGWDASGPTPRLKLYVNASDAAPVRRESLARVLGLARSAHVVGLNLEPGGGHELKLYEQVDVGDVARASAVHARLAARCTERALVAGAVRCFDVDRSTLRLRARFLALRDFDAELTAEALAELPGFSPATIAAALPFDAGAPRSLGLTEDATRWTLYLKPRTASATLHALEPRARFASPGGAVALHVQPERAGARSYRLARGWAISYRSLEGHADAGDLARLVDWWVDEERETLDVPPLGPPPPPWRRI